VWYNDQRPEVIVSGGERVESYAPLTGEKLWELTNVKAATACSIGFDRQRIYFGGSDPFSTGPLFAVRSGGTGDISPAKKNSKFDLCDWLDSKGGPGMSSPVSSGEYVYVASSNILRCYNATTGERYYQTRLPDMKTVNASPLIVDDKLLLIDENGTAVLVKVGPTFEVVGGGKIADTFWSSPAIASNSIFFRGVDALYCVRTAEAK
jgi:outer membrane protein assembly factor BamB